MMKCGSGMLIVLCVLAASVTADEPADPRISTTRGPARMLAVPAEEEVFQFVIFGDRTGGPPEGMKVLEQAVRDTNLLDPDLVMTVGDLVQGYNTTAGWLPQMKEFRGIMDQLNCPWFPVAGNHDVYWDQNARNKPPGQHEASYEKHFGPLWYAFTHRNSGFIVLYTDEGDPRTNEKGFHEGRLQSMSPAQMTFLQQALEDLRDREHVFVFMHHPRWIGGRYTGGNWEAVHRALADAGNVKAVFAGHIHRMRYDGVRDGIQYYVLASTGAHLSQVTPGLGFLDHYNVVTVRSDRVSVATVPVGSVINPRQFTPEFLTDAQLAAETRPLPHAEPIRLSPDGSASGFYEVQLVNQSQRPIRVTVEPDAGPDWRVLPDHRHLDLASAEAQVVKFRLHREGDPGKLTAPALRSRVDYYGEDVRVAVGERTTPVAIVVEASEEFFQSAPEGTVSLEARYAAVRVDSSAFNLPQGPFTLEAWVRLPKQWGGSRGLVAKTQMSEYGLYMNRGVPQFDVHLDGQYVNAVASQRLPTEQWAHVAGVFDGQELRIYIDGELSGSQTGQGVRTLNDLPLYLGADPNGAGQPTRTFGGQVDEVRLSSSVRYTDDFQPQRRWEPDASTVLLFHADRAIGPFLPDASASNATGRLVGGATIAPVAP